MKINNREQIKEILEMNISDEKKKNLIANLKNYKTDVGRIVAVDEELDIEEGELWNNLGIATSWADKNTEGAEFRPEGGGEIKYVLHVEGEVEGYRVQYLSHERIFDELCYEKDMDEDDADEVAYELSNDEVYEELCGLLGTDGDFWDEAEVLVSAETKLKIVEINDGREDVGHIEVFLEEVK